ncbi:signal peptidase I [Sediminitomix flava]|uniref:Signal peptidase I n=2 Tax=Sediminitomix flava TaxID=379075 RepID=A0A315Z6N0_SEDFL|nr:signal peptidase I [Sediminitomix flava]
MGLFKKEKEQKKKKGIIREWVDAFLFAVVAATLIRWFFMEAYMIPTPSMEKSLLVGDYLFVSKLHYGPRTPQTPLQVPLTHQSLGNIKTYSDAIQLPMFRLPGFSEVKRNDVVVFNFPEEMQYPTDLKTNYIKRCVAVGGDTLKIRDQQLYVNHTAVDAPEDSEYYYKVTTKKQGISRKFFKDHNIYDYTSDHYTNYSLSPMRKGDESIYRLPLTQAQAQDLKKYNFVKSVEVDLDNHRSYQDAYTKDSTYLWQVDNFGPLVVPQEGMTIPMNEKNITLYRKVIQNFEYNDNVEVKAGKLFIDGEEVRSYTFKQNYYFMMGDNRHNSLDSRFWGFVPEDHIVGKALFVWWSMNPDASESPLGRIRWNRIFKIID